MSTHEPKRAPATQMNEGEGSRTAARRYNAGVEKTVRRGQIEPKAREAARALDKPEGRELRRAEKRAKAGPRATRH